MSTTDLILEKLTAHLEQRQGTLEASLLEFTELAERHRRLQQAETEARRAKHEWRRADQQLSDTEDRRDAAADRLDQFRRGGRRVQRCQVCSLMTESFDSYSYRVSQTSCSELHLQ